MEPNTCLRCGVVKGEFYTILCYGTDMLDGRYIPHVWRFEKDPAPPVRDEPPKSYEIE